MLKIDGKNISIDADSIEYLFGCNGVIAGNGETQKFAFYNTGHLCEVMCGRGGEMLVICYGVNEYERVDVLGWLKKYLTSGMEQSGFSTDASHTISAENYSFFIAGFDELAPESE